MEKIIFVFATQENDIYARQLSSLPHYLVNYGDGEDDGEKYVDAVMKAAAKGENTCFSSSCPGFRHLQC